MQVTREQYDELSAPLVRVLLDMEDDILREIAAQLSRDGDISDTSKWRIRQLARAGRFDKRAAAIIAGYSEVEDGQAMDAVLTAAETEIGYLDNAVLAANAAGLSEYFSDIPAETSAMNAAKAFQRQAASGLNLVNTVMQYKAKSAYVNAVNAIYRDTSEGRQGALDIMGKGAAKAVSGQMSLQEATRKTIRELAQKGIPSFVDKRGREWSPEAYVMMDMRSTLGNTARAAQDARCDEYNIQLIEVSSHMGARPLCATYQGRIFSRDGSKGVTTDGAGGKIYYTPLSETSYGQPAGLFGINCGHVQYPFVPGINFQRYFPYPKEENDRRYMQFQQQRAMERGIRAAKRECMMLQEVGDTEGLQKASLRLRNQREKYRAYCKETGLKQHNDRTQVYGYDRSKSSKTVWAERKASGNALTNGSNSSIIKTREQTKAIIAKAQAQSRPIFAVDDEVRGAFATNVSRVLPKEGFYDVALHGTPKNVEFFGEPIDAKTLAKIIRNRKDYSKGSKVRLLSCSTGKITDTANCFAQQLANALGVEIEAPTDDIFVYPNGDFIIGKRNNGEMKIFYPRE
nr:MAG TPA: minor capsid protein [Caudoviricetes sp.]